MIAAYLDGRVEGPERAAIEAHLASCEPCYTLFSETARFGLEEKGGAKVVRPRFGRTWIALAAAACLVAAAVPLALRLRARHKVRPDVAELVAAVGPMRPFEPRLTGGFQFGPMKPVYRSAAPTENESWELLAAAAKIRKKSEEKDSVQTLADLGVAQLLLSKYDDAVSSLEEASLRAPKDARILTDLSAAYLVRAKEKDRADDYPKALEAAEKATGLDPTILEAWFNRAYALGALPLKHEAAKAWKDYLNRDPKSGWADEARKSLAAIEAQPNHAQEWKKAKAKLLAAAKAGDEKTIRAIVPDYCQETRELIEEELLPGWGAFLVAGRQTEAQQALSEADQIASIHAQVTGDSFAKEIVGAASSKNPAIRSSQASGSLRYRDCMNSYRRDELTESVRACREAELLLKVGGNPLAVKAGFQLAVEEGAAGRGADPRLPQIIGKARAAGYTSLEGLALWMEAHADLQSEHYAEGKDVLRRCQSLFRISREGDHEARIAGLLASSDFYLGETAQAWVETRSMLSRVDRLDAVHRHSYLAASTTYFRDEFPQVAHKFAEEDLNVPLPDEAIASRVERGLLAALVELRIGNSRAARVQLAEASNEMKRPLDPAIRKVMQAEFLSFSGEAQADLDPNAAEPLLREAARADREINDPTLLPHVYLILGRLLARLRRFDEAETAFRAGIAEFENLRLQQKAEHISYFDQSWDLVTELVQEDIARGRATSGALDDLEHAKARDLLDHFGGGQPLTSRDLQREIAPGAALIYYCELKDSLAIWTVRRDAVRFASVPISENELSAIIARLHRDLVRQGNVRSIARDSAALFDVCIKPVVGALPGHGLLAFVPDGSLLAVPFAALQDASTGRFLVEDHPIVVTPSGTAFTHQRLRAQGEAPGDTVSALFVSPSTSASTSRPRLIDASREVADAASFYPKAVVLTGMDATRATFLERAIGSRIVHFAGHAAPNESYPELSRLMFSGDDRGQDLLARDLYESRFPVTRLVVLSACDTGTGFVSRGEGPLSLARPFLAGGVPDVVASLWRVDDEAARPLLVAFHREIAAGANPATALRNAQIGLLGDRDSAPSAWAAFEVFSTAMVSQN